MSQDKSGSPYVNVEDGLPLAIQMATALAAIHQRGNVYGALQPTTILLATSPGQKAAISQVHILEPRLRRWRWRIRRVVWARR